MCVCVCVCGCVRVCMCVCVSNQGVPSTLLSVYTADSCSTNISSLPFFSTLVRGFVPENTSPSSVILSEPSFLYASHFDCFSSSSFLNIWEGGREGGREGVREERGKDRRRDEWRERERGGRKEGQREKEGGGRERGSVAVWASFSM